MGILCLTSLRILGDDNLAGHRTICDQLDQFKNLRHLNLDIRSYIYLTNFDGLIDKCPYLKELTFDVETDVVQRRPNETEQMIRPCPDIHLLRCDRKQICRQIASITYSR